MHRKSRHSDNPHSHLRHSTPSSRDTTMGKLRTHMVDKRVTTCGKLQYKKADGQNECQVDKQSTTCVHTDIHRKEPRRWTDRDSLVNLPIYIQETQIVAKQRTTCAHKPSNALSAYQSDILNTTCGRTDTHSRDTNWRTSQVPHVEKLRFPNRIRTEYHPWKT